MLNLKVSKQIRSEASKNKVSINPSKKQITKKPTKLKDKL